MLMLIVVVFLLLLRFKQNVAASISIDRNQHQQR